MSLKRNNQEFRKELGVDLFDRLLSNWVTWIVSIPRTTLFVISLVTLALGWVAASQFKINSDLTQLIRQEADWRKDFDHFQKEFPQLTRTAVVVLSLIHI